MIRHMAKSVSLILVSFITTVALLTACAKNDSDEHAKTYDRDGYMGLTNSNPNIPTNPTYTDYNDDVIMMKKAVNRVPGVRDSQFFIRGGTVVVKLRMQPGFSRKQSERAKKQAYEQLTYMLPRYDFLIQ